MVFGMDGGKDRIAQVDFWLDFYSLKNVHPGSEKFQHTKLFVVDLDFILHAIGHEPQSQQQVAECPVVFFDEFLDPLLVDFVVLLFAQNVDIDQFFKKYLLANAIFADIKTAASWGRKVLLIVIVVFNRLEKRALLSFHV